METRLAVLALAVVLTSLLATLSATACGTQGANQSAQNGSERTRAEPLPPFLFLALFTGVPRRRRSRKSAVS